MNFSEKYINSKAKLSDLLLYLFYRCYNNQCSGGTKTLFALITLKVMNQNPRFQTLAPFLWKNTMLLQLVTPYFNSMKKQNPSLFFIACKNVNYWLTFNLPFLCLTFKLIFIFKTYMFWFVTIFLQLWVNNCFCYF